MTKQFYSKRTEQYMKTQSTMHKVENVIKTCMFAFIPVSLVILIVLDWLRVFRISWLIG